MPSKQDLDKTPKIIKANPKVKVQAIYWTFGRYDAVVIADAPDEKAYLKLVTSFDWVSSESLLAIPREEAIKAAGIK